MPIFSTRNSTAGSEEPRPHHGRWIRLAGWLGPLSLFLTYNAIGFAALASSGLVAIVAWAMAGGVVLLGMAVCATGVALAFRAVVGVGGVQVDAEGRETAKFWGVLAGLALLVYWVFIGIWVRSWF